jgi:hypothetical protein
MNGSAHARREEALFNFSAFPTANQSVPNVVLEIGDHHPNATLAKFLMKLGQ